MLETRSDKYVDWIQKQYTHTCLSTEKDIPYTPREHSNEISVNMESMSRLSHKIEIDVNSNKNALDPRRMYTNCKNSNYMCWMKLQSNVSIFEIPSTYMCWCLQQWYCNEIIRIYSLFERETGGLCDEKAVRCTHSVSTWKNGSKGLHWMCHNCTWQTEWVIKGHSKCLAHLS